ncbi:MAG: YaiI/YqxD family protein [Candidatus Eisenbacteria bacterium]|nr:YaiI/YqxD family protein [Candidatus Eisenbacteria bacterium]
MTDGHREGSRQTIIFVDADGCPVKEEVYRVARRYGVPVTVVANSWMRVPEEEGFELALVKGDFDAADDWIAERACERDVVVTADIPLADRCLKSGARVLGPRGREFTRDSIGEAMAARDLSAELRDMGIQTGGPEPFGKRDRSRFLQALDAMLQGCRRGPQGSG